MWTLNFVVRFHIPGSCIPVLSELLKWCFIIHSTFCSTQQEVALTTENPEKCTVLPSLCDMRAQSQRRYWHLLLHQIHHNGQQKTASINMWSLHVGRSAGLLVTRDGGWSWNEPEWMEQQVYRKCNILCTRPIIPYLFLSYNCSYPKWSNRQNVCCHLVWAWSRHYKPLSCQADYWIHCI